VAGRRLSSSDPAILLNSQRTKTFIHAVLLGSSLANVEATLFRHSTLRFDPFRIEILVFLAQTVHIARHGVRIRAGPSFRIGIPFTDVELYVDSLCFGHATQFSLTNADKRIRGRRLQLFLISWKENNRVVAAGEWSYIRVNSKILVRWSFASIGLDDIFRWESVFNIGRFAVYKSHA